ncbi:hypothetical protein BDF22DRAFT_654873 [Syncephalis plumigaleata]|nr:hypothetical protein BDF22DRAFT_654873 [Syncephalis plumigaleata]
MTSSSETPRCLLVDIEGTTTSISFVHDKLFGIVRTQLASFLDSEWTRPDLQESISLLRQQAVQDREQGLDACPEIPESSDAETVKNAVKANVFWQMDDDRKTGSLKRLQGQIWRVAMRPVNKEYTVYVYSSGSVEGQKLIFTYSDHGNLQPLFAGNFDTTVGGKLNHRLIIGMPPNDILFLSDNVKEIKAADEAGLQTAILVRPGNAPLDEASQQKYRVLTSFDTLFV